MTWSRRVERGAALLDEKRPGWRDQISLAELDLSSCSKCVVGQAFGIAEAQIGNDTHRQWHTALIELNDGSWGTSEFTFQHGFDIDADTDRPEAYGDLRAAWVSYLKGGIVSCRFDPFYVFADSPTSRILTFAVLNDQNAQLLDRLERLTSLLSDEEVEGE